VAVFKEYSSGYEKDGHYVHISIPSADHPIPLQTPDEIAEFYYSIGYNAGDHVPDQLVWSLYELDLHWTGEGGVSRSEAANLEGKSAPKLTSEDIDQIQQHVESYTGEYEDELEQLMDRLEVNEQTQTSSDFNLQKLLERTPPVEFNAVSEEFTNESKQLIQQWLPSIVMDKEDREACDEYFGDGFAKSPHDHLADILQTIEYEDQLASYKSHPWTVSSVVVREETIIGSTEGLNHTILTARIDGERLPTETLRFYVQDLRSLETSTDFELSVTTSPSMERIAIAITDGEVMEFTAAPGMNSTGRFDENAISEFAKKNTSGSAEAVTHSLIISFTNLLPKMLEYCAKVPDYNMRPTDPDTDYYELTP
jgi:hypothetical protein